MARRISHPVAVQTRDHGASMSATPATSSPSDASNASAGIAPSGPSSS